MPLPLDPRFRGGDGSGASIKSDNALGNAFAGETVAAKSRDRLTAPEKSSAESRLTAAAQHAETQIQRIGLRNRGRVLAL